MTPEQIVLRFVESIGDPDETRAYLELFRSGDPERFALIDVSNDIDRPEAATLAADLDYLLALGLTPVLCGEPIEALAGLPIDRAKTAADVRRVTGRQRIPLITGDIASWASSLSSRKVILLGGPLRRRDGAMIPMVDCASELGELDLDQRHAARLKRAATLVTGASHKLAVALTSAVDLLRELFTVRGAGTLVRRGVAIDRHAGVGDRDALAALLSNAFSKPVRADLFDRPFAAVYIAADHRGAAMVEASEPAAYLSKFAVGLEARGDGIGRDLWRRLVADFPRLYWRARPSNPITGWYLRKSGGFHRAGEWNVFWIGLDASEVATAIAHAIDRRPDFEL